MAGEDEAAHHGTSAAPTLHVATRQDGRDLKWFSSQSWCCCVLLGASKSKQAGGHPPIPLRPARTTLALTRLAKQASNGGAIELLPGTTKDGHKGSCRAAREPEEPPGNLRKPEEGAYLGEEHPCRRARMVESPVRLMQPGCLRSSAGMPAPQASQVSAEPRIGQGDSRVLRRKWPVSRTPPCISSAPCPILPTWRCLCGEVRLMCDCDCDCDIFSPMLPCASLSTPAICDPPVSICCDCAPCRSDCQISRLCIWNT